MHEPNQSPPKRGPLRITVPSRADGFLRQFTALIGGPLGRRSDPGRVDPGFFSVERVIILMTTVGALLMLLAKNPCRVSGWGGNNPYVYACYSDWVPLFGARGFADNPWAPFSSGAEFEYPVLMSAVASAVASIVPHSVANRSLMYFDINLLLVAILWMLTVICTVRMTGRRPWDAAMIAIAPGIILAGSINWDMWAVALLAGGMLAFARKHTVLAGVLIGLGAAMKIYPFFILGALLVLAVRTGKFKTFWVTAGTAAATWVLVNLPYALAFPDSFMHFFNFSSERGAGFSSFWHAWNVVAGKNPGLPIFEADQISRYGLILFFLCCVGVALLGLLAKQTPRLGSMAFLIIASFVMVNKVYSPQFIVWLIPLFVLALPRWREFVIWMLVEIAHFYGLWNYLDSFSAEDPIKTFPETGYVFLVAAHMLMLAYLMYLVARSILDPRRDPIRAVGQLDPLAGEFAGAPDRFTLRGLLPGKRKLKNLQGANSD
ncbi:glycosyltransferase family 87 protein [Glutamicibacter sp. M10]|uniref:glycosyltransferase family 87 protein n=1 Tax=Glutamicibacter sp. M10 TaxID=3023076 RepID=UPI0021C9702A|nr:glycosyltransferase 87 family protein [Glutamicibacter sp. M10]UXN32433.1 glycosyltransferase 87 family protein [Glutamicibacter sp. M10]